MELSFKIKYNNKVTIKYNILYGNGDFVIQEKNGTFGDYKTIYSVNNYNKNVFFENQDQTFCSNLVNNLMVKNKDAEQLISSLPYALFNPTITHFFKNSCDPNDKHLQSLIDSKQCLLNQAKVKIVEDQKLEEIKEQQQKEIARKKAEERQRQAEEQRAREAKYTKFEIWVNSYCEGDDFSEYAYDHNPRRSKIKIYYQIRYGEQKFTIQEIRKKYLGTFDKKKFKKDLPRKPDSDSLYFEDLRYEEKMKDLENRWDNYFNYEDTPTCETKTIVDLNNQSREFNWTNEDDCYVLFNKICQNSNNLNNEITKLPCTFFNQTMYEIFNNHIRNLCNQDYYDYLQNGYTDNQIQETLQKKYGPIKNNLKSKREQINNQKNTIYNFYENI